MTQALALVSGVGTCFVGVGSAVAGCSSDHFLAGSAFGPEIDAAEEDSAPLVLELEASPAGDGAAGAVDAPGEVATVHTGIGPPPDASRFDVFEGIMIAPDASR